MLMVMLPSVFWRCSEETNTVRK